MTVRAGVERDLLVLPEDVREGGLAALALAMADEIDDPNSATSKSMCAKQLRDVLLDLKKVAPAVPEKDGLDELQKRRAARRAAAAARQSGS